MLDKNGKQIKIGDVVKLEGAYFKNDNGEFIVTHVPGSNNWSGSYCSLTKATKKHQFSKQKYNLSSWPISSVVSDHFKTMYAKAYNKEHATIEIVGNVALSYVEKYEQERWNY